MTIKHVLGCPDLETAHPEHEWISSRYGRVTCYGLTAEDVREFAHAAALRYIERRRNLCTQAHDHCDADGVPLCEYDMVVNKIKCATVPHPPVWPNYIGRPDLRRRSGGLMNRRYYGGLRFATAAPARRRQGRPDLRDVLSGRWQDSYGDAAEMRAERRVMRAEWYGTDDDG